MIANEMGKWPENPATRTLNRKNPICARPGRAEYSLQPSGRASGIKEVGSQHRRHPQGPRVRDMERDAMARATCCGAEPNGSSSIVKEVGGQDRCHPQGPRVRDMERDAMGSATSRGLEPNGAASVVKEVGSRDRRDPQRL